MEESGKRVLLVEDNDRPRLRLRLLAQPLQCEMAMNTPTVELAALGERSDYRVCAGDADPRGWSVVDAQGVTLGKAADLIIDLQALIARYILCSMPGDAWQVLIPVGFARLDSEHGTVHLDFVTLADAKKLPAFTGLPLSAEHGAQIEKALTGVAQIAPEPKIVRRSS